MRGIANQVMGRPDLGLTEPTAGVAAVGEDTAVGIAVAIGSGAAFTVGVAGAGAATEIWAACTVGVAGAGPATFVASGVSGAAIAGLGMSVAAAIGVRGASALRAAVVDRGVSRVGAVVATATG
jgi:hypothetical protein